MVVAAGLAKPSLTNVVAYTAPFVAYDLQSLLYRGIAVKQVSMPYSLSAKSEEPRVQYLAPRQAAVSRHSHALTRTRTRTHTCILSPSRTPYLFLPLFLPFSFSVASYAYECACRQPVLCCLIDTDQYSRRIHHVI